jgi:hypothetical protein
MATRLRPRSRGSITGRDKRFISFQTGSGPTEPRIQWAVYLVVKQHERESGHSPPSSAEVKSVASSRLCPWITLPFIIIILSGVRLSPLGTEATTGLLYQPQMIDGGDCGAIRGMKIGRGNRSTRSKPFPVPLRPPQIPHDLTRARTRAAAVGSQRLTAWAMARPYNFTLLLPIVIIFQWIRPHPDVRLMHRESLAPMLLLYSVLTSGKL